MSILLVKAKTLYLDVPWPERGGGKIKRGADRHYELMSIKEIMNLNVNKIAAKNCHLYMWSTNNYLYDAFKIIEHWGFRYITTITWVKDRISLGQYYRGLTEHCLFAVKGKLPYKIINGKRQQGRTAILVKKKKHSQKPNAMRKMIETVSYPPYVELFARKKVKGWICLGNEIDGKNLKEIL